jgi:hypothetical protein
MNHSTDEKVEAYYQFYIVQGVQGNRISSRYVNSMLLQLQRQRSCQVSLSGMDLLCSIPLVLGDLWSYLGPPLTLT